MTLLDTAPPAAATSYAPRTARHARRVDALQVGAWALVAAAVALFLADHGATYFTTVAGTITAIGIVAGLVATVAMCLMLVLVARVPVVDRALGQDRATVLHATLGRVMVGGILAHAAFVVSGYALTARVNPLTTFLGLLSSRDIVWTVLATLGFGVVAVSSMVAVRRRYPYEVWYAIHLTTYLSILGSLPHQFSLGGMLAPGTLGRTFWTVMWLAVAFCLLAFRVILPIVSTLTHRLRVEQVVPCGPDAVSIVMSGRHLERLGARGGHWLQWRFLTPGLVLTPHPFSLSADPTPGRVRITVRALGAGTARLRELRPGTRVAIEGPYGRFTDEARTRDGLVLVGAGIGIAPVRALLESTTCPPGRTVVVLRASTPDELYLYEEVVALCRARGAYLYVLTGPRAGASWVSADAAGTRLLDYAPFLADADLYVCGPTPWMDSVLADAAASGLTPDQIHDERFDW